jgi:hypothetical protein
MGYSQIIIEYLRKHPEKWTPSYDLEKVWLDGKWVGSSGSRRARKLAESGKIEVRHNGKYAEYHAHLPKLITEYRTPDGNLVHRALQY